MIIIGSTLYTDYREARPLAARPVALHAEEPNLPTQVPAVSKPAPTLPAEPVRG